MDMALTRVRFDVQVALELAGGVVWRVVGGALYCSPPDATPAAPKVAPEVARPADRRNGPEVPTNRRASLRASRRARRAPAAPAPTLTKTLPTPLCEGVVHSLDLRPRYSLLFFPVTSSFLSPFPHFSLVLPLLYFLTISLLKIYHCLQDQPDWSSSMIGRRCLAEKEKVFIHLKFARFHYEISASIFCRAKEKGL